MIFRSLIFILLALTGFPAPAVLGVQTVPCRKNILPGYKFVSSSKDGDKYLDASKRVTMYAQCFPMRASPDDVIQKWKPQANPKNTDAEAVYFEIPTETRKRRVYVITRKPAMQLIFETRWRNGIWLEATEDQIIKAFGKPGKSKKKPSFRKVIKP